MSVHQTDSQLVSASHDDRRPRFGIGHMVITASNVDALTDFYAAAGLRLVVKMGRMSIVELRGGTHIIIQSGEPGVANLDFIVSDIDDARRVLQEEGASPTEIRRGNPHDTFFATDPEGNSLTVHSDHSIGAV